MNATRPLAHLLPRLKTKKAKEALSFALAVKNFTEAKMTAKEALHHGRSESARWWAGEARMEWRKLAPLLGLEAPPARVVVVPL